MKNLCSSLLSVNITNSIIEDAVSNMRFLFPDAEDIIINDSVISASDLECQDFIGVLKSLKIPKFLCIETTASSLHLLYSLMKIKSVVVDGVTKVKDKDGNVYQALVLCVG